MERADGEPRKEHGGDSQAAAADLDPADRVTNSHDDKKQQQRIIKQELNHLIKQSTFAASHRRLRCPGLKPGAGDEPKRLDPVPCPETLFLNCHCERSEVATPRPSRDSPVNANQIASSHKTLLAMTFKTVSEHLCAGLCLRCRFKRVAGLLPCLHASAQHPHIRITQPDEFLCRVPALLSRLRV